MSKLVFWICSGILVLTYTGTASSNPGEPADGFSSVRIVSACEDGWGEQWNGTPGDGGTLIQHWAVGRGEDIRVWLDLNHGSWIIVGTTNGGDLGSFGAQIGYEHCQSIQPGYAEDAYDVQIQRWPVPLALAFDGREVVTCSAYGFGTALSVIGTFMLVRWAYRTFWRAAGMSAPGGD